MSQRMLFSVIIPTYNRSGRLKIALESLVNQTYKDFEVIVSDDGSTDNSKEIVESFSNRLSIKYIWNENWGGPARPRNIGITQSTGEWICFLDSDDYWFPEKLKFCLPVLENSDFIYHNFTVVGDHKPDKTQQFVCRQISNKNAYMDLLLNWNGIATSGAVVRRSVLEKTGLFDENKALSVGEDFDLWLRIAKFTNRFTFIRMKLGGYYLSSISLTKEIESCIKCDFFLLDRYKNDLTPKQFIQVNALLNLIEGLRYLVNNDRRAANKYFSRALGGKSTPFVKIKALTCLLFGTYSFQLLKIFNLFRNVK